MVVDLLFSLLNPAGPVLPSTKSFTDRNCLISHAGTSTVRSDSTQLRYLKATSSLSVRVAPSTKHRLLSLRTRIYFPQFHQVIRTCRTVAIETNKGRGFAPGRLTCNGAIQTTSSTRLSPKQPRYPPWPKEDFLAQIEWA